MIEIKLPSTDKVNNIHVYIWEPENKPEAILQISHGMKEHIMRYEEFAKFLASKGILVIGNDHLGHGNTVKDEADFGFFGSERSKTVVDDLHEVTLYAKSKFGADIPYFLLGHSMGSFMARRYLMTYGNELSGAIISGTGSQPGLLLACGRMIANITGLVKGDRYIPTLIKNMAFGTYLNHIDNPRTESDWLCKDEKIVDKYNNDKFCTFEFTVDGYKTLFESIAFIQNKNNINKIPKSLPIIFISGSEDPVGEYGKGVKRAYEDIKNSGVKDVESILYEGGRHEMLNEIEREDVYNDIYCWISNHMK